MPYVSRNIENAKKKIGIQQMTCLTITTSPKIMGSFCILNKTYTYFTYPFKNEKNKLMIFGQHFGIPARLRFVLCTIYYLYTKRCF